MLTVIRRFARKLVLRLFLAVTGVVAALLSAELIVRTVTPAQGVTHTPEQYLGPRKVGFVPHSRWEIDDPEYRETIQVNSLGYRDEEIDLSRETIVFLGDSQTFGTGVNQGERVSDLVRQYINANCPTLNVLNVSMPGASTYDERRFLADVIKKGVKVRHVFLSIVTNDHFANEQDADDPLEFDDDDHLPQRQHSYFSRWVKRHRYDSRLVQLIVERLSRSDLFLSVYSKIKFDFGIGEFRSLRDIYVDEEGSRSRLHYTQTAVDEIQKLAPVSIILIPDRYRFDPTLLKVARKELLQEIKTGQELDFDRESKLVRDIANELTAPLIDPIEFFRSAEDPGSLSFPLNGHLTVTGHKLLAGIILRDPAALRTVCGDKN